MQIDYYNKAKDREAAFRVKHECGWLVESNKDDQEHEDFTIEASRTIVGRLHDRTECIVHSVPGTMRYLDEELSFAAVTGVATSMIARKRGLASRCTAKLVAEDAQAGATVVSLGIFDQGYYDRLGFGCGPYCLLAHFAPRQLKVDPVKRTPVRLGQDDWAEMHANRQRRVKYHGAVTLQPQAVTRGGIASAKQGIGLGFRDGPDEQLSHHLWMVPAGNRESGPYRIEWLAYETTEQLIELLGLIKGLEEQVHLVELYEPLFIQLQDLLERPFEYEARTRGSRFRTAIVAGAHWQIRLCDVPNAMQQTHLMCQPVQFNLKLTDPIAAYLDEHQPWRGVGDEYIVTFGPDSSATLGNNPTLPTLEASVGAFTRMWLGVKPASGLSITDNLHGPAELIDQLDRALRLPVADCDWTF